MSLKIALNLRLTLTLMEGPRWEKVDPFIKGLIQRMLLVEPGESILCRDYTHRLSE